MRLSVTWWRCLTDPVGRAETLDWPELANDLRQCGERPYRGDSQPGWSPATFRDDRRASAGAERVSLLCLDYDQGATADELSERWGAFLGAIHTTRKSTPDAPRFRAILVLSRPVSAFEFAALWRRVAAEAGTVDEATKDPSRFWYVPGSATGTALTWIALDGEPLDVDSWLSRPEPVAKRPETPALDATRGEGGDRVERAARYVARMPESISGQKGHVAAWAVACKLVHGFELSDADARSVMLGEWNQRCSPPWTEKEIDHKITSARKQANELATRVESRPWTPPKPWSRDEAPLEEPPDWALPPDERHAEEPDPVEAAEREAIAAEPVVEKPKPSIAILSMADLLLATYDDMKQAGTRPPRGIPTGIADLDRAIGGYRGGNVTILGAKRSFGKTSFSLLNADTGLADRARVLVFGGEDSPGMYGRRFMARRAGVNATLLRDMTDPFTDVQLRRALDAISVAETLPFFVPAIGMPVERMAEVIAEVVNPEERWLVIVDYLQCIQTRRRSPDRRLEVTHIAKTLSAAIKNSGAAGLLLSQLKRSDKRRPEIEDLKESGDLEDAAEHVLLGHREGGDAPGSPVRRILILAKNKDGIDPSEVPDFDLHFDTATASFTGSSRSRDEDPSPLGRSWSPGAPAPQPWTEPRDRDDIPDGFGGLPRN